MSELIVHSTEPLNAEPDLSRLRRRFVTDAADFYVRCHGEIPRVDPAVHRVSVHGLVERPLDLSMEQLRASFAPRSLTAAMQCAGNRRADLLQVRPVSGDPWAPGAIGNAEWTGVRLAALLQAAGVAGEGRHVAFHGLDEMTLEGETFRYSVSIPIAKAMAPEVLVAWAINGEELRPEHGAPLRVVVPGYAGVRSAKWLSAIEVREHPADAPVQAKEYHLYPADVTKGTANPAAGSVIDEMPLNAAICEPADGATLDAGMAGVRGYAISAGRPVTRVEISCDDGQTWVQARLDRADSWSWVLWEADIDLQAGERALVVRAWDSAGQTQPACAHEVWNFKGYLCNAWHRVAVRVR